MVCLISSTGLTVSILVFSLTILPWLNIEESPFQHDCEINTSAVDFLKKIKLKVQMKNQNIHGDAFAKDLSR